MTAFLAFALKHWRWLALAAALIAAGLWVRGYGNRACETCRAAVVAEYQQKLTEANERTRVAEIESRKRVEAVDREYQIKLQDLDAKYRDASTRLGAIRVRQCPSGGVALSRDPGPSSSDHDAAGADGLSRDAGGVDIGPALIELMRHADAQAQRLVACQAFVSSLR